MTGFVLRALTRIFRGLTALQPAEQRRRYGPEMVAVFRQVCRAAVERRGLGGLVATAWGELWAAAVLVARSRTGRGASPAGHGRRTVAGIGPTNGNGTRGGGEPMGPGSLISMRDDAVWGLRALTRHRTHALTVSLVLALGVGAFTTVFAVVQAVVLGPARAGDGAVLAELWSHPEDPSRATPGIDLDVLEVMRSDLFAFRMLEAFVSGRGVLTDGGAPASVRVLRVTPGFLDVLDVTPVRGSGLGADSGADPRRALLTHDLWAGRYGADPRFPGATIALGGVPFTVVGILPRGVSFPDAGPAVWIPLDDGEGVASATSWPLAIGWLRSGLSLEDADAAVKSRAEGLRAAGLLAPDRHLTVVDATFLTTPRPTRRALVILLVAVGFTLLVATVNAGALVLTRIVDRARELAVRTALGSGSGRVRRQVVVEGALLGLAGGLGGAGVGALALRTLVPTLPEQLNLVVMGRSLEFGGTDLGMALGLGLGLGLLIGVSSAVTMRPERWFRVLRSGPGSTGGPGPARVRAGLVVAQIAFSFVLLSGSALLAHSVMRLRAVDPGVDAERLLVGRVRLPADVIRTPGEAGAGYDRVAERLRRLPGVEGVAATASPLPLASARFRPTLRSDAGVELDLEGFLPYHRVSPGYLDVAGVEMVEGRELRDGDPPETVVVGEVLARALWPGASAVGRRFRVGDDPWSTVVGVAGDVPQFGLRDQPDHKGEYYAPLSAGGPSPLRTYVVRTSGDPAALMAPARLALREVHAAVPFEELAPYRDTLEGSIARERFYALLLTLFAGLAMTLSVVGLYGLLAQHVRGRTREIGIRMTLGADRRDLLGGVMARGMALVAVGLGTGLAGAWALSRFLEGLLFEVDAADPLTLAVAAAAFGALALVGCVVPGARAVAVDPLVAVRSE